MADNIRGVHVSPGIYTAEAELLPAVRSLGITSLGVAGETQIGPAFEPMTVSNWREFTDLFGGTNPEKFRGTKFPKYELPYIAKSYLNQSERLTVVRVLGLSGFNGGPAWCVTGDLADGSKMVIAVIRSRGHYEEYYKFNAIVSGDSAASINGTTGTCECQYQSYDTLLFDVGEKQSEGCNKAKDYNLAALQIGQYTSLDSTGNECIDYKNNGQRSSFEATSTDYGKFKLFGWTGVHTAKELESYVTVVSGYSEPTELGKNDPTYFQYPVTLNPTDNDYILKVLGTSAENGEAPIFVESLYDVAWKQQIESTTLSMSLSISNDLQRYQAYYPSDYCCFEPFYDFMTKQEEQLTRADVGRRFMATKANEDEYYHCHLYSYKTGKPVVKSTLNESGKPVEKNTNFVYDSGGNITSSGTWTTGITYATVNTSACEGCTEIVEVPQNVKAGQIYTVAQYTDESGRRHYYYRYYSSEDGYLKYLNQYKNIDINPVVDKLYDQVDEASGDSGMFETYIAKCNADDLYYRIAEIDGVKDVYAVKLDLNNYKSQYRFASTPWFVSNLKGDFTHLEVNKLFRFHTISDGNSANNQVKISIANVSVDNGTFDVLIRDINDTDNSQVVLERYTKCNLTPGSSNYLGFVIGTYDGAYETVSKYVTVEIIESDATRNSVPCGFLGYPIHDYSGLQIAENGRENIIAPILKYNCDYDEEIKARKQYFGLSDLVGVDIDAFTFKGNMSYYDAPEYLCQGFHLDSRLDFSGYKEGLEPKVTVDGDEGYTFDCTSVNARTSTLTEIPIIDKENDMNGSIFENSNLRKFTAYFYGGFDGWDIYRDERSNGDDFKKNSYRGNYNKKSGEGYSFNRISDPTAIGLDEDGITSDYYAYLAAIRQFSNPESTAINVFCTPGIDYVYQKSLVEETIEMIEEERGDSIYVVTTPDKPQGADDYVSEMFTPEDVVFNLEDTEIDSNYTCTYYPWVKYFDTDNNQYIMLPPTKDVVRNFALTDNTSFAWYAPAGYTRGNVDCTRAHYITKLADEDTLYEGRINPIKTFAQDGVKIWGQKNLQIQEGQLNRIAVRRLLLRVKQLIKAASIKLIFEPNDTTTAASFRSLVTPILDNVKSNRGLSDYRLEVDDSVEARMRRELPAKIFLKPFTALEYITLNFIVTAENVSFDDI